MSVRLLLFTTHCTVAGLLLTTVPLNARDDKRSLELTLRSRVKGEGDHFTIVEKKATWDPKKTALIICDMWDDHWCKSAAKRVGEMAGPLNDVVKRARAR